LWKRYVENVVLRKFRLEKEEITRGWRKQRNEELPQLLKTIISRRV
jgi:hypothetical protein